MSQVEIIILIVLTIAICWISWVVSLKDKRYHGIFRSISFETIIILVLLNYPEWFKNPLAWYQVISWVLLAGSLLVAIFGFYLFYHYGKPDDGMEESTVLVNSGLYRYIRHPLYLSLILGGLGVMMKDLNWLTIILSLLNMLALYFTAKVEEKEMIKKFGREYESYMKQTRLFIPFIL